MRVLLLLVVIALPLLLWATSPTPSSGQSSKARELSELQQRIDRARGRSAASAAPSVRVNGTSVDPMGYL